MLSDVVSSPLIRPFEDRDYERLVEISTAIDPGTPFSPDTLRHRDANLDARVRLVRLVAEMEPDGVVAVGRVMHTWWSYHPRRYFVRIEVHPARQRHGIGSKLWERFLSQLQAWEAELVRAEARDDRPAAIAFLEHRGFGEWRRRWDNTLDVSCANVRPLESAVQRAADENVTITTYAAELARRGEQLAHELYETEVLIFRDEPANAEGGDPVSFERFVATEIESADALPDAHFLAFADDRLVGISRLTRDLNHPGVLRQAVTGTHPGFRDRGIAKALKLRTIEFARDHGYQQIRTGNDSTNGAMLHINAAIGFIPASTTLIFERRLDA
jgi:GNAT superfamily N-acetyltransferase